MKYKVYMRSEKSWNPGHRVNEDSYMFSEYSFMGDQQKIRLMVVADGMGGHDDGEKASADAVRGFLVSVYGKMVDMYLRNKHVERFSAAYFGDQMIEVIEAAVIDANREVCDKAERYKRTGTTLSVVCVMDTYAIITNVGDTPVFFYNAREKSLKLVSTLQTQAEKDATDGKYKRYSSEYYKNDHILTNSLGFGEKLDREEIRTYVIGKLEEGDMFLVGSDGAFGRMSEAEIQSILECEEDEKDFVLDRLFSEARLDKFDDQTALWCVVTEEE